MIKYCKYCGREIENPKNNSKFCNDECRENYKNPPKKSKINEINAEAKAAGMTYGKYVAKKYLEDQKRKEKENENNL